MQDDDSDEASIVDTPQSSRQGTTGTVDLAKVITVDEWNEILQSDCCVSKKYLNDIIMDYLVIEGFKDAAECFAVESSTDPRVSLASINDRVEIRTKISQGQISDALELINTAVPNLFCDNQQLLFRLYQQQFVEFLRQGDCLSAISFAQDWLFGLGEISNELMESMEKTITLTIFKFPEDSPLGHIMDYDKRHKLAGDVNSAILLHQCQRKESEVSQLLRHLLVAQEDLDKRTVIFPTLGDIAS